MKGHPVAKLRHPVDGVCDGGGSGWSGHACGQIDLYDLLGSERG